MEGAIRDLLVELGSDIVIRWDACMRAFEDLPIEIPHVRFVRALAHEQ